MDGRGFQRIPSFNIRTQDREKILSFLRDILASKEEVAFAYVYGSFLEDQPFHDIDVGIYLMPHWAIELTRYAVQMGIELETALLNAWSTETGDRKDGEDVCRQRFPIDVRVLNEATPSFCYHVLKGRLLFSRREDLRVQWAQGTLSIYLDSKPLRHRALKEAMISWD